MPLPVADFDSASAAAAGVVLQPCCAAQHWLTVMVAGRPYGTLAAVVTASEAGLAALDWAGVRQALDAHPRIGDRPAGDTTEARWSRAEQAPVADDTAAALLTGNADYEQRFGHVFLICASGRAPAELLAELTRRLANDEATEREVVRRELAAIVRLRLAKALQ